VEIRLENIHVLIQFQGHGARIKVTAEKTAARRFVLPSLGDSFISSCFVWYLQLLSKQQSNCENIKYYQILYERDGMSGVHHRVSTSNSVSSKNISDNVVFDAGYWVMVTAYNNQEMDSSSERVRVVTLPAR